VHGSSSGDSHTDGSNLAGPKSFDIDPHSGRSRYPSAIDPKICEDIDQKLLDTLHVDGSVGHAPTPFTRNGENRITDKLPRPVIGDVATPVSGDNVGAERLHIDQEVLDRRPLAQCDYMVVFEQEEVIVFTCDELALECQRVAVPDSAEPADPQVRVEADGRGQWTSASQFRVSMISRILFKNAAA
jgi:hypothetical protein